MCAFTCISHLLADEHGICETCLHAALREGAEKPHRLDPGKMSLLHELVTFSGQALRRPLSVFPGLLLSPSVCCMKGLCFTNISNSLRVYFPHKCHRRPARARDGHTRTEGVSTQDNLSKEKSETTRQQAYKGARPHRHCVTFTSVSTAKGEFPVEKEPCCKETLKKKKVLHRNTWDSGSAEKALPCKKFSTSGGVEQSDCTLDRRIFHANTSVPKHRL